MTFGDIGDPFTQNTNATQRSVHCFFIKKNENIGCPFANNKMENLYNQKWKRTPLSYSKVNMILAMY